MLYYLISEQEKKICGVEETKARVGSVWSSHWIYHIPVK